MALSVAANNWLRGLKQRPTEAELQLASVELKTPMQELVASIATTRFDLQARPGTGNMLGGALAPGAVTPSASKPIYGEAPGVDLRGKSAKLLLNLLKRPDDYRDLAVGAGVLPADLNWNEPLKKVASQLIDLVLAEGKHEAFAAAIGARSAPLQELIRTLGQQQPAAPAASETERLQREYAVKLSSMFNSASDLEGLGTRVGISAQDIYWEQPVTKLAADVLELVVAAGKTDAFADAIKAARPGRSDVPELQQLIRNLAEQLPAAPAADTSETGKLERSYAESLASMFRNEYDFQSLIAAAGVSSADIYWKQPATKLAVDILELVLAAGTREAFGQAIKAARPGRGDVPQLQELIRQLAEQLPAAPAQDMSETGKLTRSYAESLASMFRDEFDFQSLAAATGVSTADFDWKQPATKLATDLLDVVVKAGAVEAFGKAIQAARPGRTDVPQLQAMIQSLAAAA